MKWKVSYKLVFCSDGFIETKKVFPGPCEDRTHDLGVISTTLYRLS